LKSFQSHLHLTLQQIIEKKNAYRAEPKEKEQWQDATISNSEKSLYLEPPSFHTQPPTHTASMPALTTSSSKTV
jgi:hypothetical protein